MYMSQDSHKITLQLRYNFLFCQEKINQRKVSCPKSTWILESRKNIQYFSFEIGSGLGRVTEDFN